MSGANIIIILFFFCKEVELVGGLISTGPTHSSFITKYEKKKKNLYGSAPEFDNNYLYLPEITWIYPNLPKFTWSYPNIPEFTGILQNSPELPGIYHKLL